jgi:hypothetical protein
LEVLPENEKCINRSNSKDRLFLSQKVIFRNDKFRRTVIRMSQPSSLDSVNNYLPLPTKRPTKINRCHPQQHVTYLSLSYHFFFNICPLFLLLLVRKSPQNFNSYKQTYENTKKKITFKTEISVFY